MPKTKTTFGIIVGTRGFFNPKLAAEGRKEILAVLDKLGFEAVILPADQTPNGAVETLQDARKYADLFQERRKDIDGIVVILPNFGDELGVVQTIDLAKLGVPVLVQACSDDLVHVDVAGRRDAFCGKLSVCNNLYQYGIPFTDTSSHTCDIDSQAFAADLEHFARVCRTVRGLAGARVGVIGARPAPFQTVRYSEKLLQTSGVTVVPVDMSVMFAEAGKLDDKAGRVTAKVAAIKAYGRIPAHIPEQNILRQAKLSVAVDEWMAANECVACAVQCWDSVQNNYGCAACLSMSMMGEAGTPGACEADVAGAVSMYALRLASGGVPGFLDWNNNYGDEPNKCVCTHCSNYPKSFMGADIEISNLDILGATLGEERCFGAIKGHVAAGDMTYFRLSTDDARGLIKSYVGEGAFTDDPFGMDGGVAVCELPDMRGLFRHLCSRGFEHHVAMVRGRCADVLEEAVGKYLGWDVYRHAKK